MLDEPPVKGWFFKSKDMARFTQYLKDTQSELKHVSWPTRKQAIAFTAIVVVVALLTAAYVGAFDWLFTGLLERFILRPGL